MSNTTKNNVFRVILFLKIILFIAFLFYFSEFYFKTGLSENSVFIFRPEHTIRMADEHHLFIKSKKSKLKKGNSQSKPVSINSDTLNIGYTYWWPESGPFIGLCGEEYAFVFLGEIVDINTSINDTSAHYISQKGIIKIKEVIKVRALKEQTYKNEKYFTSDCFYGLNVKNGDKVLVFCYEYEGSYSIPGKNAVLKLKTFNDATILSIKNYVQANQNPLSIKGDMALWEKKGFGNKLKQIIECKETISREE